MRIAMSPDKPLSTAPVNMNADKRCVDDATGTRDTPLLADSAQKMESSGPVQISRSWYGSDVRWLRA
jgi:hypothetical protein